MKPPFRIDNLGPSDQEQAIAGGPGALTNLVVINPNTDGVVYVHLYDKASAAVVGTDVPVISFAVNPGTASPPSVGIGALALLRTFEFSRGLRIAVTTAFAHTAETAPTADCYAFGTVA